MKRFQRMIFQSNMSINERGLELLCTHSFMSPRHAKVCGQKPLQCLSEPQEGCKLSRAAQVIPTHSLEKFGSGFRFRKFHLEHVLRESWWSSQKEGHCGSSKENSLSQFWWQEKNGEEACFYTPLDEWFLPASSLLINKLWCKKGEIGEEWLVRWNRSFSYVW